jgi:hypothetical protein
MQPQRLTAKYGILSIYIPSISRYPPDQSLASVFFAKFSFLLKCLQSPSGCLEVVLEVLGDLFRCHDLFLFDVVENVFIWDLLDKLFLI